MDEKPLFYLGIDPSQRYQPYVYVAIDEELRIQAIGNGPMREILAYMAGIGSACVGINGPQMVNQGLVDAEEDTHSLFPLPASKRGEVRQVELQLINEGVNIVPTPAVESECMVWQRRGLKLFRKIRKLGYVPFPENHNRQFVEAPAEAVYSRLNGGNPMFDELSLEGRLQRQLILFEQDVDVKDAMNFFEEVTRFRLIKGILPEEDIYQPGELNALACAFLVWMIHNKPELVTSMGDKREGQIYIPTLQEEMPRFRN